MTDTTAPDAGHMRIAKRLRGWAIPVVVLAYIATLVVASVVPADAQVLPNARVGFVFLAFFTLTVLVVMLMRVLWRVFPTGPPTPAAVRGTPRLIPPWAVDAALGLAVSLGILWMIALIDSGGYNQRCIDGQTMTVVSSSYCESSGPPDGTANAQAAYYEWYYGGSGTQIGDEVQGGSLTEPGTDDGGGSGSGSGGSDDDGGDGGSDGGE